MNRISDEELATYLEGLLSGHDAAGVDAAMNVDTLEIISVSRRAINEFQTDNIIELPSWKDVSAVSVAARPLYEPLAMAGFLGENNSDENADMETCGGEN